MPSSNLELLEDSHDELMSLLEDAEMELRREEMPSLAEAVKKSRELVKLISYGEPKRL